MTDARGRLRPTLARVEPQDVAAAVAAVVALQPDVVLIEGVALLCVTEALRQAWPAARLIIDFHNVEGPLYGQIQVGRWPAWLRPLRRAIVTPSMLLARQDDLRAIALADQIWTCSAKDRAQVEAMGAASVAVVPNPIPSWCAAAERRPDRRNSDILFVGELGYGPNKAAVRCLVHAIMPRLRMRHPDLKLHICGRQPSRRITALVTSAGHRLSVSPPDVAPAYAEALAAIIPLASGGGTRIKVIEALAVGCPVVATAKAVEGLELEPGVHYLAAERPSQFVAAIDRLLAEAGLGARLAEAGWSLVERRFGSAARRTAMAAALAALMPQAAAVGVPDEKAGRSTL